MIRNDIAALADYKQKHGLSPSITAREKRQLKHGMPLQYIAKCINFDRLTIGVRPGVFIPRFETEELVLHALKYVRPTSRVLDLCAGSGYIGLTIKQKTNAAVTLSDISYRAIRQIKRNAARASLAVTVVRSNLLTKLSGKFDVVIANPPYIPQLEILPPSVLNFEPHRALFGGLDGNDFYRQILATLPAYLNPGAWVLFELSPANAAFLHAAGFTLSADMNGKVRFAWRQFF